MKRPQFHLLCFHNITDYSPLRHNQFDRFDGMNFHGKSDITIDKSFTSVHLNDRCISEINDETVTFG